MENTLPIDMIYNVALNSDLDDFMRILDAHPQLYKYPIWHDKFKKDFGNATYFKTWTWKENYLANVKDEFFIMYHMSNKIINPILYEYNTMIIDLTNNYYEMLNPDSGLTFIDFDLYYHCRWGYY